MNRIYSTWFSAVVCGALCFQPAFLFAEPADDEIDLETITRRLEEWRGSFVNLRVVWESVDLPTKTEAPLTEWSLTPEMTELRRTSREEWIWADHGLSLLEVGRIYPEGTRPSTVDVFNGPKGVAFRAMYSQSTGKLVQLHLQGLGVGKPISAFIRLPLLGLYWNGTAQWLPDQFALSSCEVEGFEDIAGARCARIVGIQDVSDSVRTEILWLDVNHDYLVRRYLIPAAPSGGRTQDFIVDEFQRLANGLWFPQRGRFQRAKEGAPWNRSWVVTEADVNQELDLHRFDPPEPEIGTQVDDHGRGYTYGADSAEILRGEKTLSSPSSAPVRSGQPRPSNWLIWSCALVGVSLLCMAVGFWFYRRT